MKSIGLIISSLVCLICLPHMVFAASAFDACTASDLGPHNPPIRNLAKYCSCVLSNIASAPELSAEVKSFYQKSFSRNAVFVDGQYRALSTPELQVWSASDGYKKLSPSQASQIDQIEFIHLGCYNDN